jgi:putative transposase
LLEINRSNIYYKPRLVPDFTNSIANEIKEIWSKYSFFGYRKITAFLNNKIAQNSQNTNQNKKINHKKVLRLMQKLGLQAIYAKPRTTIINKDHKKFPYLLKNLEIAKPNKVWAVDITYIKTPRGFVYLVALIDIFSRFIVSSKLSISLDTQPCLEILHKGLKIATPQIINSDQGSQFTSKDWIDFLTQKNIQISMDSVGRWADKSEAIATHSNKNKFCEYNIYIERFWRTIKQEEIYINPSNNLEELRIQIDRFIKFYNYQRPHQALKYKTPSQVFYNDENRKKRLNF